MKDVKNIKDKSFPSLPFPLPFSLCEMMERNSGSSGKGGRDQITLLPLTSWGNSYRNKSKKQTKKLLLDWREPHKLLNSIVTIISEKQALKEIFLTKFQAELHVIVINFQITLPQSGFIFQKSHKRCKCSISLFSLLPLECPFNKKLSKLQMSQVWVHPLQMHEINISSGRNKSQHLIQFSVRGQRNVHIFTGLIRICKISAFPSFLYF